MLMVERSPIASKWVLIHRSVAWRPISLRCSRKSMRPLSLLDTPSVFICCATLSVCARDECTRGVLK
jgi:hypothetical protein